MRVGGQPNFIGLCLGESYTGMGDVLVIHREQRRCWTWDTRLRQVEMDVDFHGPSCSCALG